MCNSIESNCFSLFDGCSGNPSENAQSSQFDCDPETQSCPFIATNENIPEEELEINPTKAYAFSRLGNQILNPAFRMITNRWKAEGLYRFNKGLSVGDSFKDVFSGKAGIIYGDNVIGRGFNKFFIPKSFGSEPYSHGQVKDLIHSGERMIKYSQRGTYALNGVWLAINVYSLAKCIGNDCSNLQIGAISFEAGRVSADLLSSVYYNIGITKSQAGNFGQAYRMLLNSKNYLKGFGALRTISGGLRFAVEVENYVETDDFNGAAMAYGASDVIGGVAQIQYANYMVSAADAKLTASGVKSATNVLISDSAKLTTSIARLRVVGGAAGAVVGIGLNVYSITTSVIREDITPAQKSKNIKSGIIGIFGNSLFLAGALAMVATPLAPVSILLFIAGSAVLIGQSIYDHYDEFNGSSNNVYGKDSQKLQKPLCSQVDDENIDCTPVYIDRTLDTGFKKTSFESADYYQF